MTCAQCGEPLPEDSPSDDFCIPNWNKDCQREWNRAQATRPEEIDVRNPAIGFAAALAAMTRASMRREEQ